MLILLIGPKGSGKSHVGRLLESSLGVCFVPVERHWMAYHAACAREGREPTLAEGIARVHPRIEAELARRRWVCVETTGASPEILEALLRLRPPGERLLVRVEAPLELCLARIAARNPDEQLPAGDDLLRRADALSRQLVLPFDFTVTNQDLSREELLAPFVERGVGSGAE